MAEKKRTHWNEILGCLWEQTNKIVEFKMNNYEQQIKKKKIWEEKNLKIFIVPDVRSVCIFSFRSKCFLFFF